MIIEFIQEKLKWRFTYLATFGCGKKIKVTANRTILSSTSRDVLIQDEQNNTIVNMKEKRILKKILSRIPVINFLIFMLINKRDKYHIYQDSDLIGSIEWYLSFKKDVILISYKHRRYEVYNRAKGRQNRFYIFEGEKQIGIIDKNYITQNKADQYKGTFNNDTDEILNIIILTFIDLSLYTKDITNEVYTHSSEREYTLLQFTNRKLGVVLNDDWKAE